ncbi:Metalloprotease mig-17 [Biomphalaria glabrata]|nr:A disintegrin and metalloproteinase with thrombospondin motifs 5 [Biomphalaria glabrata]
MNFKRVQEIINLKFPLFLLCFFDIAISFQVQLKINPSDIIDKRMPSVINVTLTSDTNASTELELSRVEHINSNLPIYTIDGEQITKQNVEEDEFVAFYQDTNHQAVIHVVRQNVTDAPDDFIIKRGEYVDNNIRYSIQPNTRVKREANQLDSTDQSYEVKPVLTPLATMTDYVLPPQSAYARTVQYTSRRSNDSRTLDRRRRQSVSTYYIDITAFVEFNNYKLFLDQASNDEVAALKKVQEYYAFIFTGMDLVYQNFEASNIRLRIKLTKIIIFKNTTSFQLTYLSTDISRVDTDAVLTNLKTFLASSSGRDLSFPYDHAMLFVGADLWKSNIDILGLAWLDTICLTDGYSSSVIEDYGYYSSYLTAAHELGHSLSANHDGDGNACSYSDHFLMASSRSATNETTKRNPWMFSDCTKSYFTSCINTLLDTTSGRTCLSNTLSVVGDIPDVSSRLLGQEIPADKQCQMRYGTGSSDCKVRKTWAEICQLLYCLDPSTSTKCYGVIALSGTSCGSNLVCYQGDCVNNTVTDIWTNCTASMCLDTLSSAHCPQTCKYSTFSTASTSTSSKSETTSTKTSISTTYASTFKMSSKASTLTYTTSNSSEYVFQTTAAVCYDNTSFTYYGLHCQGLMRRSENLCYNEIIETSCCESCSLRATSMAGCEYGDRDTNFCRSITPCRGNTYQCCLTCNIAYTSDVHSILLIFIYLTQQIIV